MTQVNNSAQAIQDPLYEVGASKPINKRKQGKIKTKVNLPIPKSVIFFREFKQGETMPIYFKASGNIVSLDSQPQELTFLRDVFVKVTREELLFSLNQKDWLPFLEVFTGKVDGKVVQDSGDSNPKAIIELFANAVGK